MYYQSYEDYIRSILGYPVQTSNNYQTSTYNYSNDYEYTANTMPKYSSDVLDLYPEIYKIVNPMVCKICEANTKPITRELVEQMTDEIYLNIEGNTSLEEDTVNVRVTVPSEKGNSQKSANIQESSSSSKTGLTQSQAKQNRATSSEVNNAKQDRQFRRNTTLRDLIKILILNQLLGGRRPPQRPGRPRPPFPGGPGQGPRPNPRPPINPRDYDLM